MNFEDVRKAVDESVITDEEVREATKGGPLAKLWKLRTLADAFQPREPLLYLIDGLLAAPSLNIIYGPPGSMKSMVVADMAVCVALGKPFLEPLPDGSRKPGLTMRTTKSKVLWIDMDNGPRRTDVRFDALGKAHGGTIDDKELMFTSLPDPRFNAADERFMEEFKQLIEGYEFRLIVIDNLGLAIGDTDENKAEMARVMSNFKYMAEELGACIVIIHHPAKGGANDGVRLGDKLRGHSTIEASLDAAFYVDRLEGSESIAVVPTKVREFKINDFGALFTYEHHEGTYDLAAARFWSQAVDSPDEIRRIKLQDAILTVMHNAAGEVVTRTQLKDAVTGLVVGILNMKNPSSADITGQITMLTEQGFLEDAKEGRSVAHILTDKGFAEAKGRLISMNGKG